MSEVQEAANATMEEMDLDDREWRRRWIIRQLLDSAEMEPNEQVAYVSRALAAEIDNPRMAGICPCCDHEMEVQP